MMLEINPKIAELIAQEKELIEKQSKLFTSLHERAEAADVQLLVQRLSSAEAELENHRLIDRDFSSELKAIGSREQDEMLKGAQVELNAARSRLHEQDRMITRMEEWMGIEIAQHKGAFDEAVEGLLDQASRLTIDEARALTEAASTSELALVTQQGAGTEAKSTFQGLQKAEGRRKSVALARDAQLIKKLSASLPGGGKADEAADAAAEADRAYLLAEGEQEGGDEEVEGLDLEERVELINLRRRLPSLEEELSVKLEAAAASETRLKDDHRREMSSTTKWALSLEEKCAQSDAALHLEREEVNRLEEEVGRLRPMLAELEERVQQQQQHASPGSSAQKPSSGGLFERSPPAKSPGGGGGGGASRWSAAFLQQHSTADADPIATGSAASPSKRIQKARAMMRVPVDPGPAAASSATKEPTPQEIVVGTPMRPEERALRPAPMLMTQSTTAAASPSRKMRMSSGSKSWPKGGRNKMTV